MQLKNINTFSIIVPLFNEEENIFPLVQTILQTVGDSPQFLEIILVDDGSGDLTASIAAKLVARDSRIVLIKHEQNQGLGGAIRTGLDAAAGDFVLYTDADLPFDFSLIPQLFSRADENCVLTGYRTNRGEGLRRWVLTKGYNFLVWFFFGLNMSDVNFACKVFPKSFLRQAKLNSKGSFIDVEILLESRRLGLEIVETPMAYYPRERGLSTLSRPAVVMFILKEMFDYKSNVFSKEYALLPRGWRFVQRSLKLKTSE